MVISKIAILSHLGICTFPVQDYILDVQAGYWKETEVKKITQYEISKGNQREISLQRDEIQKGLMIF